MMTNRQTGAIARFLQMPLGSALTGNEQGCLLVSHVLRSTDIDHVCNSG